ncbi:unnamed protein product [Allacma fusca]|uniref:Chitin-binding type-2 domain-containing protein n=1 Tax=Allacma fusca TaxID=39272 RepID=A0A8J2NZQ0_9HEXA|nr:unnamed protein product [Allacma fusca]
MGKILPLILILTLAVLLKKAEGRAKYRCAHCKPRGLYNEVFAYITREGTKPDKVKLNLRFFQQSRSCNKPIGYKIPHEKRGRKFYMCQDGVAYEFECTGDRKFNRQTRACGNARPAVDPQDVDETYVPGSVFVYNRHGKKRRLFTGIIFNHKPDSEKKKKYRETK